MKVSDMFQFHFRLCDSPGSASDWKHSFSVADVANSGDIDGVQASPNVASIITEHTYVLWRLERKCAVLILKQNDPGSSKLSDKLFMVFANVHIGWTKGEVVEIFSGWVRSETQFEYSKLHRLTIVALKCRLATIDWRVLVLLQVEIRSHDATAHVVHSFDRNAAIVDVGGDVSSEEGRVVRVAERDTSGLVHV